MKHHRRSIRLPGYDYSQKGAYFVTICTRNGECILTKSVGVALAATHESALAATHESALAATHEFELTEIGKIVDRNWLDLRDRFPMVALDEYIVMPNHLHGIVILNDLNPSMTKNE